MKKLLILLLLAGCVNATCQTDFDYCMNITIPTMPEETFIPDSCLTDPRTFPIDLSAWNGLTDLEENDYVSGNLSRVYVAVYNTTNTKFDLYVDNTSSTWDGDPRYPQELDYYYLKLVRRVPADTETSASGVIVKICMGGLGYYPHIYDNTYPPAINLSCTDGIYGKKPEVSEFTKYYRRNWTFLYEGNGSIYNFGGHNATLTVSCPGLSSFNINMTLYGSNSSMTAQTIQWPRYSLQVDGVERLRQDKEDFLKDNFIFYDLTQNYRFNLVDYTAQCNNLLYFQKTFGDTLQNVWVGTFGMERDAYVYLSNSSEYRIYVLCQDNSIRDFGSMTLVGSTTKNIEVTNILLSGAVNKYSGGLTTSFSSDVDSQTLSFNYAKTSGSLSYLNMTVYDISESPMEEVYSVEAADTPSGSLTYNVGNVSHTYWLVTSIINDGQRIYKSASLTCTNQTIGYYLVDLNLPPTVLGVYAATIYKLIALGGVVTLALGFAPIDAGYGAVAVVGWVLLTDLFGWIHIASWLKVVIGLLALALLWGLQRRHDE